MDMFEPEVILQTGEDPIERLFKEALYQQVLQNRNPYLTYETLVYRVLKRVRDLAGLPSPSSNTETFYKWHEEIRTAYESKRKNLTLEEQMCVERVLAKDAPQPSELIKFATCWMKHEPTAVCRWFAVDGILGSHPKLYVHEAFSPVFEKHARAVRALYAYVHSPDLVKEAVQEAFSRIVRSSSKEMDDPDVTRCVDLYIEMAGVAEVSRMDAERTLKRQQQQLKTTGKRKKVTPSTVQEGQEGGDVGPSTQVG